MEKIKLYNDLCDLQRYRSANKITDISNHDERKKNTSGESAEDISSRFLNSMLPSRDVVAKKYVARDQSSEV